jgi:hypothetical protein
MDLIVPHIHRIRKLSINVMFSSSLPSFPTDFHGTAAAMRNLELQCKEDDGGSHLRESVALTDREEFRCPKLEYLAIDGRNCYEACRSDPQWTDKIDNVTGLTITHFHPNPGESFSLRDLLLPLTTISHLASLRIADLVLHPSPEPLDIPNLHLLSYDGFLRLEDFHGFEVVDQILRFLDQDYPYDISFTRCTFEDITYGFNYFGDADNGAGGELSLVEIDHDLAPLLRLWHGHTLNITDCPRFDDALLDVMGSKENGAFNCATFLEHLRIQDCPNFSVAALRRFVESRLNLPLNHDLFNPVSPRLQRLQILGSNVPSVSQVERAWFDANVIDSDDI